MDEGQDRARLAYGTITNRDPVCLSVTVYLTAHDITTQSLRVLTLLAHGARCYALPRIGDFVACLLDDTLNNGVVLGGLYTHAHPTPTSKKDAIHMVSDDGAVFEHDPTSSTTLIDIPAPGKIMLRIGQTSLLMRDDGVTLTTPRFDGIKV